MTTLKLVARTADPEMAGPETASSHAADLKTVSPVRPAPRPIAADPANFRAALRHLAGGVSVITAGQGAERTGLVATSVSSLSAEPPTLMFGLNLSSSTYPVLRRCGSFGVNFLSARQTEIANRFAGRGGEKGLARYAGAQWTEGPTGAALLDGALASLDCEVEELIERHSHAIVIGRIREIRLGTDNTALLYWRGEYKRLGALPEEALHALGLRAH